MAMENCIGSPQANSIEVRPPLPSATLLLFFVLCWCSSAIFINTGDLEQYTLQHAGVEALVERGTFTLGGSTVDRLRSPGDTFTLEGRQYAAKQPGQFVLAAIPYRLISFFGISYASDYPFAAALVAWCSAGLFLSVQATALLYLVVVVWGRPKSQGFLVALSAMFGQTAFAYVSVPHHDLLASTFLAIAFVFIERARRLPSTTPSVSAWIAGGAVGMSVFTSMLAFPAALGLTVYGLRSFGAWHHFFSGIILGVAPLLSYNAVSFGHPLLMANAAGDFRDTFFAADFGRAVERLRTYFGDGDLALWKYSPIAFCGLLGFLVAPRSWRSQQLVWWAMIGLHLGYIFNIETVGHCQFGPRYLLPIMPFLLVGLCPLADRLRPFSSTGMTAFLWAAFGLSAFFNLFGALGGTMYCSISEWGVGRYLTFDWLIDGRSFPLLEGAILGTLLLLSRLCSPRLVAVPSCGSPWSRREVLAVVVVAVVVGFAYYASNPQGASYDYTARVAHALLTGHLGLDTEPPSWLTEFVPHHGMFYSVFPLGSVLTMLPVAVLQSLGVVVDFPAWVIVGILGAVQVVLVWWLARGMGNNNRICLAAVLFFSFGTWHWCNLTFGGAWQIAIGVAVIGQLGALYFSLIRPSPFVCGAFFALAFGNRTELLLLAPVFLCFLWPALQSRSWGSRVGAIAAFGSVPLLLGIATLWYNFARFGSIADFGYARIPGVLSEPWYQGRIFHLDAIWPNFREMLLVSWRRLNAAPYLVPTGFGGSILLSCPLLVTALRRGAPTPRIWWCSWVAILLVTTVLWLHGNPGGWQYSYRYAAVLLPWFLLLMLDRLPERGLWFDATLLVVSIAINSYATYLFHWTRYVQP